MSFVGRKHSKIYLPKNHVQDRSTVKISKTLKNESISWFHICILFCSIAKKNNIDNHGQAYTISSNENKLENVRIVDTLIFSQGKPQFYLYTNDNTRDINIKLNASPNDLVSEFQHKMKEYSSKTTAKVRRLSTGTLMPLNTNYAAAFLVDEFGSIQIMSQEECVKMVEEQDVKGKQLLSTFGCVGGLSLYDSQTSSPPQVNGYNHLYCNYKSVYTLDENLMNVQEKFFSVHCSILDTDEPLLTELSSSKQAMTIRISSMVKFLISSIQNELKCHVIHLVTNFILDQDGVLWLIFVDKCNVKRMDDGYDGKNSMKDGQSSESIRNLKENAAIIIQTTYRGFLSKVYADRIRNNIYTQRLNDSATKIQSIWRGNTAVKEYRTKYVYKIAAIEIQRIWHGWKAKIMLSKMLQWYNTEAGYPRIKLGIQLMSESKKLYEQYREELEAMIDAQEKVRTRETATWQIESMEADRQVKARQVESQKKECIRLFGLQKVELDRLHREEKLSTSDNDSSAYPSQYDEENKMSDSPFHQQHEDLIKSQFISTSASFLSGIHMLKQINGCTKPVGRNAYLNPSQMASMITGSAKSISDSRWKKNIDGKKIQLMNEHHDSKMNEKSPVVPTDINPNINAVFQLARHGRMKQLKQRLKEGGFGVNTQDESGNTLLFVAIQYGKIDIIDFLIHRHADLNIRNIKGNTVLHFANAYDPQGLVVEYLIDKGADDSLVNNSGLTCYDARVSDMG